MAQDSQNVIMALDSQNVIMAQDFLNVIMSQDSQNVFQGTKNDRSIAYHYLFFGIIIYGNFGNHMV